MVCREKKLIMPGCFKEISHAPNEAYDWYMRSTFPFFHLGFFKLPAFQQPKDVIYGAMMRLRETMLKFYEKFWNTYWRVPLEP